MGALYGAVLFLGINNASSVQPVVGSERPVFYRERAAGLYSAVPYALAQALVEVPYVLAQTIIYSLLVYFLIRFEINAAKVCTGILDCFKCSVFNVTCTYAQNITTTVLVVFPLLICYVCALDAVRHGSSCHLAIGATGCGALHHAPVLNMKSSLYTQVLSSFFYSLWNLFSGFLITRPQMPPWLSWYYYLNPVSWSLAGLISTQLGDVDDELLRTPDSRLVPVSRYIADTFAFDNSYRYWAVVILLGFVTAFAAVLLASLRFLNWQKR